MTYLSPQASIVPTLVATPPAHEILLSQAKSPVTFHANLEHSAPSRLERVVFLDVRRHTFLVDSPTPAASSRSNNNSIPGRSRSFSSLRAITSSALPMAQECTTPRPAAVKQPSWSGMILSQPGKPDAQIVPPPIEWLQGTWHFTHSTLPIWRDKRNISVLFTLFGGSHPTPKPVDIANACLRSSTL